MINKFHEIDKLLSNKLANYANKLSSNELQNFLLDKFSVKRFIIEVRGRNRRFNECREMVEDQCELLTKLSPRTLKQCPSVISMHSELSVLVHLAYRDKSNLEIIQKHLTSTPEAVMRLEHLSLNPSGKNYLLMKLMPYKGVW